MAVSVIAVEHQKEETIFATSMNGIEIELIRWGNYSGERLLYTTYEIAVFRRRFRIQTSIKSIFFTESEYSQAVEEYAAEIEKQAKIMIEYHANRA